MDKKRFDDLKIFECGQNKENIVMFMNKETFETIKNVIEFRLDEYIIQKEKEEGFRP